MIAQLDDLTDAVAAFGLPGALVDFPDAPLMDDDWASLLARTLEARTSGLLQAAVHTDAMPVTDDQREQVLDLHTGTMVQSLFLEALLLATADQLDRAGIPFRVLKGSAVAHLDYTDPALRAFGDVDLLVRSEDFDAAVELLQGVGHRRLFRHPGKGSDRRFGESTTLATADGLEIDLHRRFVLGPYALTVDLHRVWDSSESFDLGGRQLMALDAESRVMHAAFHAILGGYPARALALRDVAEMLLFGCYDDRRLIALGESWQSDAVLARAVRLTWQRFRLADVTRLSAWAARHRATPEQARRLALYETDRSSYAPHSLAAVAGVSRFRDKVAFLRTLSLPDGALLAQHNEQPSRVAWLIRGVRRHAAGRRPT